MRFVPMFAFCVIVYFMTGSLVYCSFYVVIIVTYRYGIAFPCTCSYIHSDIHSLSLHVHINLFTGLRKLYQNCRTIRGHVSHFASLHCFRDLDADVLTIFYLFLLCWSIEWLIRFITTVYVTFFICIYHIPWAIKMVPLLFRLQLCQMLTDLQNFYWLTVYNAV